MATEKIMAEITPGSGTEGVPPAGSQTGPAGANEQVLPQIPASSAASQLEQPKGVEGVTLPWLSLEERIVAIHPKDRMAFVLALPPDQQPEGLRVLGLIIKGGAGTEAPDYLREAAVKSKSDFQSAREVVELSSQLPAANLAELITAHPELSDLLAEGTRIMNEILRPTDAAAQEELERVLYFVRDDIRRVYTEATQSTPKADPDSWYGPPTPKTLEEQLEAVDKALGNYQESFWDYGEVTLRGIFGETADIRALKQKYEGVASYLAARAAAAISKELRRIPLQPDPNDSTRPEFGDYYLDDIKGELEETRGDRERIRREERKRATADERLHYNNWREKFDFTWAETPEELNDSVEDWLDYFQQQLPLEAEEAVYQEVTKGLNNALASLEQARNRIGLEANSVIAQRLREKIVGHVTTIAGAKLLESRDGFEYFIKLRRDFASNYDGYYDGIYKKKGFAIMGDKLSENGGAIYKGGPEYLNKPLAGDTKTFRGELEREAVRYGATHELYITDDDFEIAKAATEADRTTIRDEVVGLSLSEREAQEAYNRALRRFNRRYGWGEDDVIEELLLLDQRGLIQAQTLTDPQRRAEAITRVQARTGVFRRVKEMLDKEDMHEDAPGHFVSLDSLTPDQRKEVIRRRIRNKITEEGNTALLQEIDSLQDHIAQDKALWKWVRDYNRSRIEFRKEGSSDEPWFPSLWDMERLSINTPEDLIDRVLSKEEFEAMVEEIDDPYKGLTDEQISRRIIDEFRVQVQREVEVKNLSPEDTTKEFGKLMQERQRDIRRKIGDVLFERNQRELRAIRNYNLNISQDKFLGLQARWGGLTTRVVNENGDLELRTIFSEAEKILKAKIDTEEAEIKRKVDAWKTEYIAVHPGLSAEELEDATIKQRRLLRRNATFAATLGLRELGIANDLPIWNYFYYGDVSQIGAFAPLVGYTDDEKDKLIELLDRGRREMEAVFSFLADQYMDGRILVVKDSPGLVIETEDGVQKNAHEESWVRPRVINEGGVLKLRDLFEARFMVSTSGGVKIPDLISRIADLGVFDELWENGCKDKREWQGFRKRRNRWELREQSFFNTREWADPVTYVQRLAGAATARKALVGGEIQGQGKIPGALNEPYDGLWQYRPEFLQEASWKTTGLAKIGRDQGPGWEKQLQDLLENDETQKLLDQKELDQLVKIGGGVLKYLILLMNLRDYVRNRAGYAPKNWQYDNEVFIKAFVKEAARRRPVIARRGDLLADGKIAEGGELLSAVGGEVLGSDHLGYAIQGRSRLVNAIFQALLRTSSYHTLDEADRRSLDGRAKVTKEKMAEERKGLVNQILPAAEQQGVNNKKQELETQDQVIDAILAEFDKLMWSGKDTVEARRQYGERYYRANQSRHSLEVEVARLTNAAVEAALNKQFTNGELTHQALRLRIVGRRQKLRAQNVSDANLELEINRLINQYIDYQLHEQFTREWPARLAT